MQKQKRNVKVVAAALSSLFLFLLLLASCKDVYKYDNGDPAWLGDNIYKVLQSSGHYTCYLALVDALGMQETLTRTGSKTLFPADDDAFARYFKQMGYSGTGPSVIKSMTPAAQRQLFNASMLNMSYLDYMLANVPVVNGDESEGEGVAIRRLSSSSYVDTVPFVAYKALPQNTFWQRFEARGGIYLADNQSRPNLFFTAQYMAKAGVTAQDWNIVGNGLPYLTDGFYVNNCTVEAQNRNVTCKNGYLHYSNDVVLPLRNMAQEIEAHASTSTFASLMDKFSAPYYDGDADRAIKAMNPEITDSVFVKRYFNDSMNGGAVESYPDGKSTDDIEPLYYDPSYNTLLMPTNMAVMFVPSNEAMETYWNSKNGAFLKSAYGSWDKVPLKVLGKFIKNHQLTSFIGALPHNWGVLTDEKGVKMGVAAQDVTASYLTCNGLVYETNRVFPPIDFRCVYAPTLTSPYATVMNVAIENENLKFNLYLRSLENDYNLLVPTNEAMKCYRDPLTWALWAVTGVDERQIWSFRLVDGVIYADIYSVDANGEKQALKKTIGATAADQQLIENRLNDILDMHIVVADNAAEPLSGFLDAGTLTYGLTKGGTLLHVTGKGNSMQLAAGGDIELGTGYAGVAQYYETENGRTFFIDKILQDPFSSVYSAMQSHPRFSDFFALLQGDPTVFSYFKDDKDVVPVFDASVTQQSSGIGEIVTSFNNFRYTVLVPTNEALKQAFAADPNLWSWSRIADEEDYNIKKERCLYLLNFLKYHFVDGIVPVSGAAIDKEYETAARDANNQFIKIAVKSSSSGLTFDNIAHVVTSNLGDYNIITRDYIVNNRDARKADRILASSRAVIHLVDHVANYKK